jgi:hypothetical protein
MHVFGSIREAQEVVEAWRRDYNEKDSTLSSQLVQK